MTSSLITALRRATRHHDRHVRAATELLIDHDYWLRRVEFTDACVRIEPGGGDAWISFSAAREAFEVGDFRASTSQRAVLDVAIALGTDHFRLTSLGRENAAAVRRAVDTSLTR